MNQAARPFARLRTTLALSVFLAVAVVPAHADSEIKIQGKSTTTGAWIEIDDDADVNRNDSPRGGNGTEFGNVARGDDKVREFRIQNKGNETLTVTSVVADSSQYEFTNIVLPATIAPNDDYIFGIRYTPLVFGTRTLRVVINNDEGTTASGERRYTFRVSGTGIGPDLNIVGGSPRTSRSPMAQERQQ